MVQGWPGLSQQAGCDQETGHTDRGAGDAGSEDNYLIISRGGEETGDRRGWQSPCHSATQLLVLLARKICTG